MKLLRLTLSILSLVVVLGVGTTMYAAAAGDKCNCIYTQTGEYGVQRDNDCKVENCWIPIELES